MTVSAQTGLNWFLLSLQTAKPSDKKRYCCFHHQDFWTKYFFFFWYDDVYRVEGHTAVDMCVKHSWKKLYLKVLMRETCLGFFNIEDFTEVTTLTASGGFFKTLGRMLYIPESSYDLHKYFRFSLQLFNNMENMCKRLIT